MTRPGLKFVSFEPRGESFIASLSIEELISSEADLEPTLRKAAELYEHAIKRMRTLLVEIQNFRISRKPLPARKIWQLGDAIFTLRDELETLSFEFDGLYDHLTRDLGVKRKWLEKVIIFRRYLPELDSIPESLNWGRCEKGTRQVAQKLRRGTYEFKGRGK